MSGGSLVAWEAQLSRCCTQYTGPFRKLLKQSSESVTALKHEKQATVRDKCK